MGSRGGWECEGAVIDMPSKLVSNLNKKGRENFSPWLVGLLIGTAIMENCMDNLKEMEKQNYHVIYKSFFGAYMQ